MKPPLRCPFWPTCEAELSPVEQRVRPGSDEVEYVYPIHGVEGPEAWFGTCPASHFLITYLPDGEYRITEYAQETLKYQGKSHTRLLVERLNRDRRTQPQPDKLTMYGLIEKLFGTEVADANVATGRISGADRPPRPVEESFPGRPADAPEPGAGEAPAMPVPPDVGGTPMTGRDSMSDREALKGIALIAANQLGQLQGMLDRCHAALDEAGALAVAAEHQVRSAQVLVFQAVGTGAGAPPAGEQMAEYTALAVSTIGGEGEGGNLIAAIGLATQRIAAAQAQVSNAESNARQYSAIP